MRTPSSSCSRCSRRGPGLSWRHARARFWPPPPRRVFSAPRCGCTWQGPTTSPTSAGRSEFTRSSHALKLESCERRRRANPRKRAGPALTGWTRRLNRVAGPEDERIVFSAIPSAVPARGGFAVSASQPALVRRSKRSSVVRMSREPQSSARIAKRSPEGSSRARFPRRPGGNCRDDSWRSGA